MSLVPTIKEKLNLLKETIVDTQENLILSKDKDAKTGHKSADSSFFGVLTSGEIGDGPELPTLLKISQENGIKVDTIIGDAAYSGKENLELTSGQDIKVVARLNPSITQGFRKDEDKI